MTFQGHPHHDHEHHHRVHGPKRRSRGSGFAFGFVLIVAGTLFLLDNLDIVEVEGLFQWWPLLIIAIGVGEFIDGSRLGATIWVGVGGWFLLNNFDYLAVNLFEIFWPALLTLIGSILVWQALTRRPRIETSKSMTASPSTSIGIK